MADEAEEPAARDSADEWTPPRELMVLLAGLLALACAALILVGVPRRWTSPTLGVLLLLGIAEALVATGLAVTCALAGKRKNAVFIPGIAVTALSAIALAAILLLSGII